MYLKPAKLGLAQGDQASFTVTAPHKENANAKGQTLVSIPVTVELPNGAQQEGLLSLNLTHQRMMIDALGDDSDKWVGATFRAIVVTKQNPSAGGADTLSWQIIEKSIVKPGVQTKLDDGQGKRKR